MKNCVLKNWGVGVSLMKSGLHGMTALNVSFAIDDIGLITRLSGGSLVVDNLTADQTGTALSAYGSDYASVVNTRITSSDAGFVLSSKKTVRIKNNTMTGVTDPMELDFLPSVVVDSDYSNTIDGKMMAILQNASGTVIEGPQWGFVFVLNSTNITARNMVFSNTGIGISFHAVANSTISNITARNTIVPVELDVYKGSYDAQYGPSYDVNISNLRTSGSQCGIYVTTWNDVYSIANVSISNFTSDGDYVTICRATAPSASLKIRNMVSNNTKNHVQIGRAHV